MGALGEAHPKALLPLGGVPVVRFALERLRRAGVGEATVNLHHRAEALRAELGERACGIDIHYSFEPEILGTAGGLKKAEAFLREPGEPFFVLNADVLSAADLGAALAHHRAGGYLATLVLRAAPDAKKFGLLAVDGSGRLRRFLNASAPGAGAGGETEAMFTGQSVLGPEFLDHIPAGRACGISEEVYPPLIESGALIGGVLSGAYWADVGTPARYLDAAMDLMAGRYIPEMDWPGGEDALLSGGEVDWDEGRVHLPVLIGRGVRLRRGASAGPFAALGSGAILEERSSVSRTVVFPGGRVGEGASLERCVIGPGAFASPGGKYFESVFAGDEGKPIPF
jgi:NDP-sugar pyrophosphorylase family protein